MQKEQTFIAEYLNADGMMEYFERYAYKRLSTVLKATRYLFTHWGYARSFEKGLWVTLRVTDTRNNGCIIVYENSLADFLGKNYEQISRAS